ncbi:polysaccharide biosynthesis tyrosine autokinase [Flavobacterium pallidum]|uniref:non-specific protein-tyrosine kinase n=1 Tax=Flavobacterium pallidum TaxID=2172098 RepID=A0A2S1SDK7_9FLAO|nr:polysaccharide biosynthesis tyrosine autokinase [Flavobacterium pallidum]AWI24471.1 sugar transporter [Flavobacterium pallidum]
MLDTKDFSFFESENSFDFKGFLIKTASYWRWFLVSWIVAFTIAYQVNIRKEKIYGLETTISVKEENNPFFTANTSLVFNWGGTSDQVQTIASTLRSRSHNELVVSKLDFFIDYLKEGKYNMIDAYGEAPFYVEFDKKYGQLAGIPIRITFLSESVYQVYINFESDSAGLINYSDNSNSSTAVSKGEFKANFRTGEKVKLPFLNWKLFIKDNPGFYKGNIYFVRFNSFDGTVSGYQGINVEADAKGGSILKLSLQGTNKARIVKYLNTTVQVLKENELAAKNQFATNTINFIDSTMIAMEDQIKRTGDELKAFTKGKNLVQIEGGGAQINGQLLEYEIKKDEVARKIAYYNNLRNYLKNESDFSKLTAPAVAGIEDPNIVVNVSKLISLSTQRSEMKYAVKSKKMFDDFDNQMDAIKNILLENIVSAKSALQYEMNMVTGNMNKANNSIKQLPEDQQELLKIQRKYDLNSNIYNDFLKKRTEADIVKAANVSDIKFIDPAKDVGGGLVGPKTGVNYVLALFLGFIIPLLFVFGIFFVNNSIQNTDDVSKLTTIPLIGVIGKKHTDSNLSVFERPKSALSESFRAIRSSLQFLYKKQNVSGAKTLMITSSVSGEGKTFCSINIATVFAMSEKKTIIIGLDLRKPKIFGDFKISNDIGAVNYLIGQKTLDEIIQPTHIPFLDVITSGPIPPNPAELILSDGMRDMLLLLKEKYDYIILDTPPIGLVSDALELAPYSDVILYVIRQNFTKKDMITLLNTRYKRDEIDNVSIILNSFESKAKYGYGYGYSYGYGYGYGSYSNGYHEDDKKGNIFVRALKFIIGDISLRKNKGD